MRVSDYFQNVQLSCNSLDVIHLCDFVFLKYFDCNFLLGEQMNAFFHFTESALPQSFG